MVDYFSLIVYQNSTSGSLLKVSRKVEPETISIRFYSLLYINIQSINRKRISLEKLGNLNKVCNLVNSVVPMIIS